MLSRSRFHKPGSVNNSDGYFDIHEPKLAREKTNRKDRDFWKKLDKNRKSVEKTMELNKKCSMLITWIFLLIIPGDVRVLFSILQQWRACQHQGCLKPGQSITLGNKHSPVKFLQKLEPIWKKYEPSIARVMLVIQVIKTIHWFLSIFNH